MEISVGYPSLTIATGSLNAKYSGVAVQGDVLFPLLNSGLFSIDFDLSYRYTSLTNNASTAALAEWGQFNGLGTGVRFNYSYLFAGIDYQFMRGKHLKAGTVNELFEYDYNPTQWQAGLALPLSPVTSVVLGYSQILTTELTTQNQNIKLNEQIIWFKIQIDFGISFFNLLAPGDTFAPTRNSFFVQ